MSVWYLLLKFVHVSSVIVWLGGVISLAVLNAAFTRGVDATALRVLTRINGFVGPRVLGPATGLTLLSGLGLMLLLRGGMRPWMGWGLTAMILSGLLGATLLRRANERLAATTAEPEPDGAAVAGARRRLNLLSAVNVVLLLSAVLAMVTKPGG